MERLAFLFQPVGAVAQGLRPGGVAAFFEQQREVDLRVVVIGIEIESLPTVGGGLAMIPGRVADQAHEVKRRRGGATSTQVLLTAGGGFYEVPLIGEPRGFAEVRRRKR